MKYFNSFISQLPKKPDQYAGYLLIGALCAALFIADNYFNLNTYAYLAFDRNGLLEHQYWRAITAHNLHTNIWHLLLNLLGLLLLWLLHGDYAKSRVLLLQFFSLGAGISLCIYLFNPSILWYVGLSGVLHGLFVIGAILDVKNKRFSGYLLLVGVIIKILDEQLSGPDQSLQSLIQANVAIDAHLYGAFLGLPMGIIIILRNKK